SIAVVSKEIAEDDKQYKLRGLGLSSAMHSLIAMDKEGNPLTNCIIWADSRSKDFSSSIKSSREGHDVYLKTGTHIHPMSPLCKLAWMIENMEEVVKAADKFISIKEYVCFKLFGQYIVDYS